MDLSPEPASDPPAYTPAAPAPPTHLKRTIDDTRNLILSNAAMFSHHMKIGQIQLVIGKWRGKIASQSNSRSFHSATSDIRISIPEEGQAEASASTLPELRPSESNPTTRGAGKHYAALVSKSLVGHSTDVIIMGVPQDSVEEALEWMLDKTETVVTDVLSTHRRQAVVLCCKNCGQAIRGE